MMDQNYLDTAHLLRRAGFGASPDTIRDAAAKGLENVTHALLNPDPAADTLDDDGFIDALASIAPETATYPLNVQAVKIWWIHRMLMTPDPLQEKMTLFWHGHFTSRLGGDGVDMLEQNKLLRKHALGNFRTLTQAISRDPAMLKYLNGNQNVKAHPNENYGRELMELFTCGIGNYTENDVKAASKAFTGWNLREDEFWFNERQHDDSVKTFMGKTGNWNGNDIVDILVAHPSTARRLCTQLFTYFAYPDPEPAVLSALTKTYYDSGYDIKAVVGQILRSRAFYSDKARNAVIKSPAQFVVGTIRMLGMEPLFDPSVDDIRQTAQEEGPLSEKRAPSFTRTRDPKLARLASLPNAMRTMGQDLLAPPTVKGWDGGEDWINSSTLMNRVTFGQRLAQMRLLYRDLEPKVQAYAAAHNLDESGAWVDYLAETLGPLQLQAPVRSTLVAYVSGNDPVPPEAVPAQVTPAAFVPGRRGGKGNGGRAGGGRAFQNRDAVNRYLGLLPLVMGTAEYQVC